MGTLTNILIGTLILQFIEFVFVLPLTKLAVKRKLGVGDLSDVEVPVSTRLDFESLFVRYYILFDVFILSVFGFFGGLFGFWFIGFSSKSRGWPGMVCFIIMSFLGFFMSPFRK